MLYFQLFALEQGMTIQSCLRRDYCCIFELCSSFCPGGWKWGCSGLNGCRVADPNSCCVPSSQQETEAARAYFGSQSMMRLPTSCLEIPVADLSERWVCLTPLAVLKNIGKLLWCLLQISKWNHARHGCPVHFMREESEHAPKCSFAFQSGFFFSWLYRINILFKKPRTQVD